MAAVAILNFGKKLYPRKGSSYRVKILQVDNNVHHYRYQIFKYATV